MTIREAPHSPEAERSVLGSVFIKPAAFNEVVDDLTVDDFLVPVHRDIFEAMVAIDKRRQPLDFVAVADELKTRGMLGRLEGGESYLIALANSVPTAENALHYARLVREKATLRRLIAACAEVQSTAYGDFGEFETFLEQSVGKVAAVAMRGARAKSETLETIFAKIMDNLDREERGEVVSRIPTGIAKLDELMDGGMANEHLVVPCALTSIGKSSWGLQVVVRGAAERGVRGLIFTIDMTKAEMFIKGACSLTRMDTRTFVKPATKEDWMMVHAAGRKMAALKDILCIEEHRQLGQIVAASHAWRARNPGPAVIMVDHIQKVAGHRPKNSNREEEVAGIAAELKNLARDLKLPVIAPSQLNEESVKENRAPRLGDLRESKAIGHEADVVLGIHRDRNATNGTVELLVLKHRGGKIGKRTVNWVGAHQGFEAPDVGSPNHEGDNDD